MDMENWWVQKAWWVLMARNRVLACWIILEPKVAEKWWVLMEPKVTETLKVVITAVFMALGTMGTLDTTTMLELG